ncbi:hypothetical protein BDY19DRAFT_963218 [Irpex rosettiformis]|uniref:Uncharacterized protein n=1 Tax=Irpex rosettiformis TaxID=378272 RepID=A0ACB8TW15_9APHY|nr:hypothetical protein BDY19DRAFT_963218 [Irpex rosettiformis]
MPEHPNIFMDLIERVVASVEKPEKRPPLHLKNCHELRAAQHSQENFMATRCITPVQDQAPQSPTLPNHSNQDSDQDSPGVARKSKHVPPLNDFYFQDSDQDQDRSLSPGLSLPDASIIEPVCEPYISSADQSLCLDMLVEPSTIQNPRFQTTGSYEKYQDMWEELYKTCDRRVCPTSATEWLTFAQSELECLRNGDTDQQSLNKLDYLRKASKDWATNTEEDGLRQALGELSEAVRSAYNYRRRKGALSANMNKPANRRGRPPGKRNNYTSNSHPNDGRTYEYKGSMASIIPVKRKFRS